MSLLTNWGYTLTDADTIPAMLTAQEYADYSGRDDDITRVNAEISAACGAIRNFVGWHLYPAMACKVEMMASDRRVTFTGKDVIIQLPARHVASVTRVAIAGTEYEFFIDPNGLLYVFGGYACDRYTIIVVEYTAGLSDELMAPIKELIAHRVTHSVAVPSGITSEAAGGVSVTYNANWINNSRATGLAGDNKELLIPYKVQGVF